MEKRPTTKTSEWRTYPSDEHAFTMRDDEPEDESVGNGLSRFWL